MKTLGWVAGALGLLLGAGTARAQGQAAEQLGLRPTCRDAGVTVSFTTGSSELDTNAKGALNGVAQWLKANDGRTMKLMGYADPTGTAEGNLVLSDQRAQAVKDYLVAQGIDASRIMTVGRGEVQDHLPAEGRTVTFIACQPASAAGQPPAAAEETPPAPPPEQAAPEGVVPVTPMGPEVPQTYGMETGTYRPQTGFGVQISAGGGGGDYTNSVTRANTGTTGVWNVRAVVGTRTLVGFEGDYVGGASSVTGLGLATNNNLIRNGLSGLLRLQYPIVRQSMLMEPFIFGGVGWDHYAFRHNPTVISASVQANDNTLTVPAGGGFAFGYKGFISDARFTYVPTFNDTLFGTGSALTNWNVSGTIGYEF
jgi:hypothetical protein